MNRRWAWVGPVLKGHLGATVVMRAESCHDPRESLSSSAALLFAPAIVFAAGSVS